MREISLLVIAIITFTSTLNCNRQDKSISSIKVNDGKYFIDTSIIKNDVNLKKFIDLLSKYQLTERKYIDSLPNLIKGFILEKNETNLLIANPDENYMSFFLRMKNRPPKCVLLYLGVNKNCTILTTVYSGSTTEAKIELFETSNNQIIDYWYKYEFFRVYTTSSFNSQDSVLKYIKIRQGLQ